MSVLPGRSPLAADQRRVSAEVVVRWNVPVAALAAEWRRTGTGDAELRVVLDASGARAVLIVNGVERTVERTDLVRMVRAESADGVWLHVEASPIVMAVVRERDGRVVMARSGLWERLGVGGGRYGLVDQSRGSTSENTD